MSTTDTVHYSVDIDLHYSPDDGGWYAQDYPGRKVSSKVYGHRGQLIADLDAGRHQWESAS